MKENKSLTRTADRVSDRFLPYIALAVIPFLLFLFANLLGFSDQPSCIEPLMWLCILGTFAVFFYSFFYRSCGGQKPADLLKVILLLGFILRIGYMLYTHMFTRAHDIGGLEQDSAGHISYIWTLYTRHQLPQTNDYQFYHPPFFHLVSLLPLSLFHAVMPSASAITIAEAAKLVSCFASCGALLVSDRICNELSLNRTGRLLALSIIAFHPTFILMGGRVNNDAFVTFFMLLIVLYTIRWYRDPSCRHTVILALAFGFGMMTKISCGTMAFFTAPVMLYVWWKKRKTPEFMHIFAKGMLFLAICAPLALWYPIRNLIRFGQPLNYVLDLGSSHPVYVGQYSLVRRFFSLPISDLGGSLYIDPYNECNLWLYVLRSAVMGEFSYEIASFIPALLVVTGSLLAVISLAAMLYVLIRGKKLHPLLRFGMPFLWLLQFGSFLVFQLQYPYACSMDFRYIPLTCIAGALMIGSAQKLLSADRRAVCQFMHVLTVLLTAAFCILSTVMYCSI